MPITEMQSGILRVIASKRDPESFVAGGVPINRAGPRVSADIDIFHDRAERVATAALADAAALAAAGYSIIWLRQQPAVYAASIRLGADETKLEWVADSDYRFFPIVADAQFGFVLHIVDLGINKVMAAASRREPRDLVDLLTLHARALPIGALVWAATEIAPGYTPEGLIAEIRRNARYPAEELRQLASAMPLDANQLMQDFKSALRAAEDFVASMPTERAGQLFLQDGRVVQPDAQNLQSYISHRPVRRGHWPTNPELTAAMLARLQAPP
jgi:hypothetical protein